MENKALIEDRIRWSARVKMDMLEDPAIVNHLQQAAEWAVRCYRENGKILFCGNGGSAADAQHIAAELSGRFLFDRPPLFAEALHVNTSFVTAVSNDYSYDRVFSRMVNAMGRPGDLLFALSTSGNSKSIIEAARTARSGQMKVIGLTGRDGGELGSIVDIELRIPSEDTARIQECHILLGHILCEIIEMEMFGN
ncbi:D-sedoheptulose-7-phosphate isomerase [Membranihabitans maritimus]|uniref:D-sedoheptulose-7-phosphate isomerase n=1 Tax=Membranihabitans maritimus TaxID=2904244 RepID=UPI001F003ED6|nr:SIS domain-containing protein [Membranihabitans maritimus]